MFSIKALFSEKFNKEEIASSLFKKAARFPRFIKFFKLENLRSLRPYLYDHFSGNQDWDRAEDACRESIKSSPRDAKEYRNLAVCLLEQEKWNDALEACNKSILLDDKNPWIHHTYGRVYIGLKNYRKAIESLQKSIENNPEFSWSYYNLGEALLFNKDYEQAIPILEKSIELNPDFPWAKYHLGQAFLAQDRFEEMLSLYQTAYKAHPEISDFNVNVDYEIFLQMQERRIRQYCHQYTLEKKLSADPSNTSESLDILMVAPQPTYPLNSGGGIRMHYQAQSLSKKHRLVLVSFIFSPEDFSIAVEMEKYCDLPIVILSGDCLSCDNSIPNLARLCSSHQMIKVLNILKEIDFDITCFEFISTAQYRSFFPDSYAVLGEHNIESEVLRRFKELEKSKADLQAIAQSSNVADPFSNAAEEIERLSNYENKLWPDFQLRTVVSEQDKILLERRCPSANKTLIVKNGIDTKRVQRIEELELQRKLFFFGTLNYFPNVDGALFLVEEIMPLVWESCPDLQICIAGRNPPQEILSLGDNPLIQVVPNPESIEDLAQECSISVVPLRLGGGTRLKILHSMAMGLPNISTSLGCEGLEAEPGEHLIVRDSPQDFAQAIVELDSNIELQKTLSHSARLLVEEKYDWENIFDQYEEQLCSEFKQWRENNISLGAIQ